MTWLITFWVSAAWNLWKHSIFSLFSLWRRSGHKWRNRMIFKNSSHSSWQQAWARRQHALTVYSQLCLLPTLIIKTFLVRLRSARAAFCADPGCRDVSGICGCCSTRTLSWIMLARCQKNVESRVSPPAACPLSVIWVLRSAVCSMTILTHANLPSHS